MNETGNSIAPTMTALFRTPAGTLGMTAPAPALPVIDRPGCLRSLFDVNDEVVVIGCYISVPDLGIGRIKPVKEQHALPGDSFELNWDLRLEWTS